MIRLVTSIIVHGISAAVAYIATGAANFLSGRGIWGILPSAHEVREFSIYLFDVLPFFIVALMVLTTLLQRFGTSRLLASAAGSDLHCFQPVAPQPFTRHFFRPVPGL